MMVLCHKVKTQQIQSFNQTNGSLAETEKQVWFQREHNPKEKSELLYRLSLPHSVCFTQVDREMQTNSL